MKEYVATCSHHSRGSTTADSLKVLFTGPPSSSSNLQKRMFSSDSEGKFRRERPRPHCKMKSAMRPLDTICMVCEAAPREKNTTSLAKGAHTLFSKGSQVHSARTMITTKRQLALRARVLGPWLLPVWRRKKSHGAMCSAHISCRLKLDLHLC